MESGDLESLYLEYQHAEDFSNPYELQFTLPPDLTNTFAFGKRTGQPRQGPRGGKMPLRPRQQQLYALEAELEQKLRDLRAAESERERLQQRIKVLEVVLPVRERQVQLLTQRRQAAHVWPPPAHAYTGAQGGGPQRFHAPRIKELHASACSGGVSLSSGSESGGRSSGDVIDPGAEAAAEPRDRFVALNRPAISWSPATDDAKVDSVVDAQIAPFTCLPAHNPVPCHVLRQLSSLWKQWVREAGLVLHAHDARPHDPAPQLKLAQLHEQLAPTFHSLRLEHPNLTTELMYINMETGQREEPPPDSYWIPVAQAMRMSPQLVADARAALALYNERTAKALEERRSLAAQLGSHMAVLQKRAPQHWRGARTDTAGQLALQVDDLAGRLYSNVMGQGSALEVVKDFMGASLCSLVQLVRVCVLSYPYFPDLVAVLSSLDSIPPRAAAGQNC